MLLYFVIYLMGKGMGLMMIRYAPVSFKSSVFIVKGCSKIRVSRITLRAQREREGGGYGAYRTKSKSWGN